MGPDDATKSSALVLTVPHGGSLKPTYILPDRTTNHPDFCPSSGCRIDKDSYTREIAIKVAEKVMENYCSVPYVVINELHRSKLDANREKPEATFNNTIAINAWQSFHDMVKSAQQNIQTQHGTVVGETNLEGVRGLLFDVHGYAGTDWVTNDGSPFIQWGYRLSKDSLNPDTYCPLDDRSYGTIGTLTHGRNMPGQMLECLVRGDMSLGTRFNNLLPITSAVPDVCGSGLPSYSHQSPYHVAMDSNYCEDYASYGSGNECHYYSGDFDVDVHEFVDWETKTGVMMNTVQAELPKCVRWATSATRASVHASVGEKLAIVLCSFVRDLFGGDNTMC
jgi:hypothetical protein